MAERDLITTVNETRTGSEEDLIEGGKQQEDKLDGIRVAMTVAVDNSLRQPADANLYGKLVAPYKGWKKDERS